MIALFHAPLSQAADHLDGSALVTTANAMADINDVYAWMTSDSTKVNLALTVSPHDDAAPKDFGPTIQYVFHVMSHPMFGMPGPETRIICTFASNTNGQCWVVDPTNKVLDYVSGDLSSPSGRVSASGKFRVFAGRRSDPFFFNLSGFLTAQNTVRMAGNLPKDAAGCPQIDSTTANALRMQLQAQPSTMVGPCAANERDCFLPFNVQAIVVQVDKTELNAGNNKIISVWASTHATP